MTKQDAANTVAIHMRVRIRKSVEQGYSPPSNLTVYAQGMRTELLDRGVITVEPSLRTIRKAWEDLKG